VVEPLVLLDTCLLQQSEFSPSIHNEVSAFLLSESVQTCWHTHLESTTLHQIYSIRFISDLVNHLAPHALNGSQVIKQLFELVDTQLLKNAESLQISYPGLDVLLHGFLNHAVVNVTAHAKQLGIVIHA